jgi:uncharacterized protein YhaN
MKISRLEIEGFGPFARPRSISFSEKGLNVVYGGNESGKSTLMEAIYATIFGFEKKEKEESFKSWFPSSDFAALVEFKTGDVVLKFYRNFSSNNVTVTKTEGGKPEELFSGEASPRSRSEEKRAYAELLHRFVGFSDGALARKTSFVGQLDLKTEFTPELRGLISGAGPTDYQGAIELLKSRFSELTVDNPWGPMARRKARAIEETQDALAKTRAQLQEAENLFSTATRIGKESGELEKEIKQLKEKRVEKREFLSKIGRLVELQNKLLETQRLLRSEHAAKEDFEKVKKTCEGAKEKLCREYALFTNLKGELSSALSKAASIEEEIDRMESELSDKEAVLKVAAKPIPLVLVVATSVGIFILFLLIGAFRGGLGLMMALGALIAIVLAGGLYVLSRSRSRELSGTVEGLEGIRKTLSDLKEGKARLKEEVYLSFPDEEVRALVKTLGMRNLAVQYGKFTEARRTFEDIEKDLLQRQVRAGGEGYAAALNEAAVAETKLEQFLKEERELISLKDDPEKATVMATQARTEVEKIEKDLDDLDSKLRGRQLDSARLSATTVDSPEVYQEKIRNLEKALARLALRRDALKLAVRVLDECVAQYQAESIERVSGRISEAFEAITQGRYKAVRVSPELEPVLEISAEIEIGPDQVSKGAQDQLYFSMRVAMIEELSGGRGLPLILDDPFVNFDDQRLERARGLLATLVEQQDMQIIIFTHGDRHLTWDANVIRLT